MAGDVEVQDAPAIRSWPMMKKQYSTPKGQPALGGLRVLGRSFHPAGNGGFRHVEAEHQEFAMDARRTPTGIVSDHLKDQFTDLLGDPAATAQLTNAFSKKLDNLKAACALHFAYYNFCRIHQTLRVTPAMEAGLTDHTWKLAELLAW
jgi:hypothetical protein